MSTTTIEYFSEEPDLKTIQRIVQGYFTIISLPGGKMMYVNEEGLLLNLSVNKDASAIAGFKIYGNALIIG